MASFNLARAAFEAVPEGQRVHVGPIVSRDHFYRVVPGQVEGLAKYGVLGVEMEAAAMYGTAAEYGKEALTVLTVSDHLLDPSGDMSAEDRESKSRPPLPLQLQQRILGNWAPLPPTQTVSWARKTTGVD
jgi:purine-nucleoside phosphorylase